MTASSRGFSRRQFLSGVAKAGIFAAAAPLVVPSKALGRDGAVAPSERIVMAGLGIGGRGSSDLRWAMQEADTQFVAICDVRKDNREKTKAAIDAKYGNKDCKEYVDLREFLAARTDIDALVIATSERWHALASILAMRAGKDVYCEKPSSMCIADGRAMMETAKRYGRVYQTGTQRRSEAHFVYATMLARTGKLGKLHTVIANTLSAEVTHEWYPAEPQPPKEEIDWDLWLGPVPWRPYSSRWVRGGWHGRYDTHTGGIGEWGSHTVNGCSWAADADDAAAISYEYPNNTSGDGLVATYANGIKCVFRIGLWRGSCGMTFQGSEGWTACADGYSIPDVSNPALLADFRKVVRDYVEQTQRPLSHMRDFLNCVKTRRPTIANESVAHHTMSTCHAANICMWLKRNLKYDPVREEFINDDEANRLRVRAVREPWRI